MRTIISFEVDGKQVILNGLSQKNSLALAAHIDENKKDFIALEAKLAEAKESIADWEIIGGVHIRVIKKSQQRESQLREALEKIRHDYGQVCADFALCEHLSCRASHGSWVVADKVLDPRDDDYAAEKSPPMDSPRVAKSGPGTLTWITDPRDAVVEAARELRTSHTQECTDHAWADEDNECVCGTIELINALEALDDD